jgi:hypothetical protein
VDIGRFDDQCIKKLATFPDAASDFDHSRSFRAKHLRGILCLFKLQYLYLLNLPRSKFLLIEILRLRSIGENQMACKAQDYVFDCSLHSILSNDPSAAGAATLGGDRVIGMT